MKKVIIAFAVAAFLAILGTVAVTAVHKAVEESNRTIERIDRKIELYGN